MVKSTKRFLREKILNGLELIHLEREMIEGIYDRNL